MRDGKLKRQRDTLSCLYGCTGYATWHGMAGGRGVWLGGNNMGHATDNYAVNAAQRATTIQRAT